MPLLNFTVDLTELPDGTTRIAVTSPVGEASVITPNPFTDAEIAAATALLADGAADMGSIEQNHTARQLGQRLFQFLIRDHDDIYSAYFASLAQAGNDGLRLRLSVDEAGKLADLPWELLADPQRDFLGLSRSTPLTRYTRLLTTRPPVPVILPLRVLVMIATPRDFPALNVEDEWQRLNEATAELQERGLLLLERLEQATLIALQRRLRADDYHVFHYIGHSAYDEARQIGLLALEREDDAQAQLVPGASLARELSEETTIRLVVLNSCQSGRADQRNPFSGIASSLVTRGIPAVVAMQYPISDGAAAVFAEEFYRLIADTVPIDTAVSEARRAIANRLHNLEWATPALYLRSEDGVLFRLTPTDRQTWSPWVLGTVAIGVVLLLLWIVALLAGAFTPPPPATPAPRADLEIVSIRNTPLNPAPGEAFRLLIGIRNAGDADSGPFSWTWDASPIRRDALGGRIDNIPPGATYNLSFPFTYGWWGSYSSLITVDIDGEVVESDERNNRDAFIIELDRSRPFVVDFTLLPSNEIVVPPRMLAADEFALWSLNFVLDRPGCADAPLALIASTPRILLAPAEGAADCGNAPLAITIDQPAGGVSAVVVASGPGDLTMTLYADAEGTEPIYESAAIPVAAGQTVPLNPGAPTNSVRRIEIAATGQPVQLSKLTLLPTMP
jgi:hypothetical protein